MVAPMFGLPNLFTIERRLTDMAEQLTAAKALVAQIKESIAQERTQVNEKITSLKAEVNQLQEQVEELATQPLKKVDLTELLESLAELETHVQEIYVPETTPVDDLVTEVENLEDEPEEDDEPTVPLDDGTLPGVTDSPEPDVLISTPDSSIPAEGAPDGVVFDEPA